jgi:hypothetical protein
MKKNSKGVDNERAYKKSKGIGCPSGIRGSIGCDRTVEALSVGIGETAMLGIEV